MASFRRGMSSIIAKPLRRRSHRTVALERFLLSPVLQEPDRGRRAQRYQRLHGACATRGAVHHCAVNVKGPPAKPQFPLRVASEASRISPTVFHPAAVRAFRILVENRTFSMGVSSGSSGAG